MVPWTRSTRVPAATGVTVMWNHWPGPERTRRRIVRPVMCSCQRAWPGGALAGRPGDQQPAKEGATDLPGVALPAPAGHGTADLVRCTHLQVIGALQPPAVPLGGRHQIPDQLRRGGEGGAPAARRGHLPVEQADVGQLVDLDRGVVLAPARCRSIVHQPAQVLTHRVDVRPLPLQQPAGGAAREVESVQDGCGDRATAGEEIPGAPADGQLAGLRTGQLVHPSSVGEGVWPRSSPSSPSCSRTTPSTCLRVASRVTPWRASTRATSSVPIAPSSTCSTSISRWPRSAHSCDAPCDSATTVPNLLIVCSCS